MEWLGPALSALGASGATMFGAWLLFRGRRVDQEIAATDAEVETKKVETTAAAEFLKGQQAFQTYIDELLEKRVDDAVGELRTKVADLEGVVATMQAESHELHVAVRSRETQLWLWNIRGRSGPMPEFPTPILEKLNLTHLTGLGDVEDTQPLNPT